MKRIECVVGGTVYRTATEAAKVLGCSRSRVTRMVAAGKVLAPQVNVTAMARELGANPHTVHHRMHRGDTLEQALANGVRVSRDRVRRAERIMDEWAARRAA
jgi:transposase-like protein